MESTPTDVPSGSPGSEQPLVSIVICSFNGGEELRHAVESALGQSWSNLEVLLVDDGSTDGSIERLGDIADPRLRIIRQENQGKPAAMNRALDELSGEFYAILDADDLSHAERIERQVGLLLDNPDVAGAFCGYELLMNGRRLAPRSAGKSQAECARDIAGFRMPGHDPTAMYRVSMIADLKYEPGFPIGEGLDYILRVGEHHSLMVCPGTLYTYRVSLEGLTKKDPSDRNEWVRRVLRRACERRGIPVEQGPPMLREKLRTRLRPQDRDNNLAAHFIESVIDLRAAGRRSAAIRTGWQCARLHPLRPHYLKALIYSILPAWSSSRLRRPAGA